MWYFKQTAKSLWQASKGMVMDTRTPVQRLLDQIACSQQQIISTTKLNELAQATYQIQKFEQTFDSIIKRIKTFQYDIDEARKTLNVLIATNYLIKHGATAFVDQLRNYLNVFRKYQTLKELKTYEDQVLQKQLIYELQKIKSRAKHIQVLLQDKQKLLKQKELSMLIKQKMKLYEKSNTSESKQQNLNNDNRKQRLQKQRERIGAKAQSHQDSKNGSQSMSMAQKLRMKNMQVYADKLDGFLEKYLWKYVDKLDGKLQAISDKVMDGFDKYVLGELPQNFQPDNFDEGDHEHENTSGKKMKKEQSNSAEYQSLDDDDDLMKKLEEQGSKQDKSNLIDFQQVGQEQLSGKKFQPQQESLI